MPDTIVTNSRRVFISYSQCSAEHCKLVRALSDQLVCDGVNATIDQYETTPLEGWPQWMVNQIEAADFVLLIISATYALRFRGMEQPGRGLGASWEGKIVTQILYNQGRSEKFIPVLLEERDKEHIPLILQALTYYDLSTESGYERLYRHLTDQHLTPRPPLGPVRHLPVNGMPSEWARKDNTPASLSRYFTGRELILKHIGDHFSTPGAPPLILWGLSGVGKTQTVLAFIRANRTKYPYVLWVTGDSSDRLRQEYANLARVIGVHHQPGEDPDSIVDAVRSWLSGATDWLLIFDNVEDLGLLPEFLPANLTGHVLITTTVNSSPNYAERLNIVEMSESESVAFLLRRSNLLGDTSPVETVDAHDVEISKQLCRELGFLPLAIEQAGAYIAETPSSLMDYLHLYRSEGALLRSVKSECSRYGHAVSTTWSLAFSKVEQRNKAAADLLQFCALVSPDALPEEVIVRGGELLGDHLAEAVAKPLSFELAIRCACQYSLLRRNVQQHSLSMHRVVQAVICDHMDDDERHAWAQRVVDALSVCVPPPTIEAWPVYDSLHSHANAAIQHIEAFGLDSRDTGRFLYCFGTYMTERGYLKSAERFWVLNHDLARKHFGDIHPSVGSALGNLGKLYLIRGDYDAAETTFAAALAIFEQTLGSENEYTARIFNNLAAVYRSRGDIESARRLLLKAIVGHRKAHGANHPLVAQALSNLAGMYVASNELAKGKRLVKRALSIALHCYDPDHPELFQHYYNVGNMLSSEGRNSEAEEYYTKALSIGERCLGAEHANVGLLYGALADIRMDQGKWQEAESHFTKSIEILTQVLGPNHLILGRVLWNYGCCLERTGRGDEAVSVFHMSAAILDQSSEPLRFRSNDWSLPQVKLPRRG